MSVHLLVKLPEKTKLHNKDIICEIQIRTIVQDAWSEIEHYLSYKSTKEEKNEELLRKMSSLAGMFELADSSFEEIQRRFSQMMKKKLIIKEKGITSLKLFKFSKEYFIWFREDWSKKQERRFYALSSEIKKLEISSISELKNIMIKHKDEIKKQELLLHYKKRVFLPARLLRIGLALEYGLKFDNILGLNGFSDNYSMLKKLKS